MIVLALVLSLWPDSHILVNESTGYVRICVEAERETMVPIDIIMRTTDVTATGKYLFSSDALALATKGSCTMHLCVQMEWIIEEWTSLLYLLLVLEQSAAFTFQSLSMVALKRWTCLMSPCRQPMLT